MHKRVLVVSHNVFGKSTSMGKTLANFFDGWEPEKIAQLYFHTEVPTTHMCNNYFRITDFDVLRKKKKDIGQIFKRKDIQPNLVSERIDEGTEARVYQYAKKRKPYMYVGRNFIWSLNKWKNKKLMDWINEFNPEVIFYASGDYVFSYKIAMEIAKYKNIPIVSYVCDDYYFVSRKSISPLYHLNRMQYIHTLKKLFSKHKNIVAICDKITKDYQNVFGIKSETVMTVSTLNEFSKSEKKDNIVISYIGNMGYNRHLQLIEIGKAIKEVTGNEAKLNVYSAETRPEVLEKLTEENGIIFHGVIPYDKVIEVMKKSDILVHTESNDKINADKVRYSVSTKIADTLSCGRCLFAYGPADVASIEYLSENNCACVVTKKDELKEKLSELILNAELRNMYEENALKTAKKNHTVDENCSRIKAVLEKAVEESNK